jgi:DNA-binding transcriptional regulator YiaG
MKKETNELERYLEDHDDELVDSIDEDAKLVRHAKEDVKARKARAIELQKLRREKLKLSQSQLAQAVGANVRTLQSWETGRQDYPKSVEILMTLMNQIPRVKQQLLSPISKKEVRPPVMKHKRRIGASKVPRASKKGV